MNALGLVLQCADAASARSLAVTLQQDAAIGVGVPVGSDLPIALMTDEPERVVSDRVASLPGVVAVHLVFAQISDHGGES
jgi:hypothetical protein